MLPRDVHSCTRVGPAFHHDVLQHVVQTGLDGSLVFSIDLQVVGDGPQMTEHRRGIGQHQPGGIAIPFAGGHQLLERNQTSGHGHQLVLSHSDLLGASITFEPGCAQLAVPIGSRETGRVQPLPHAGDDGLNVGRVAGQPRRLSVDVGRFSVELRQLVLDATASRGGVVEHVPQQGRRIDRRKHLAS